MCLFFIFKKIIKFSKIQALIFLQIPLNSDQHLHPSIFFLIFFPKKIRGVLGTPLGFNSKS
jgi:hypothetical protein